MNEPEPVKSVLAEAPPAVKAAPVAVAKAAAKLELDGDEIIQLSIKPSLWYIPIVSLNVVVATIIVANVFVFFTPVGEQPRYAPSPAE